MPGTFFKSVSRSRWNRRSSLRGGLPRRVSSVIYTRMVMKVMEAQRIVNVLVAVALVRFMKIIKSLCGCLTRRDVSPVTVFNLNPMLLFNSQLDIYNSDDGCTYNIEVCVLRRGTSAIIGPTSNDDE